MIECYNRHSFPSKKGKLHLPSDGMFVSGSQPQGTYSTGQLLKQQPTRKPGWQPKINWRNFECRCTEVRVTLIKRRLDLHLNFRDFFSYYSRVHAQCYILPAFLCCELLWKQLNEGGERGLLCSFFQPTILSSKCWNALNNRRSWYFYLSLSNL